MNRLLDHGILLAQQNRLDEIAAGLRGRRTRFDTQDIIIFLLVVVGIAVAAWGLSYLLRVEERRRGHARPLRLFLSLCKAHRLRWSEQWLLWRVARAQRLRDPARLFLEPQRLEAVGRGRSFQTRQAQFRQIRDRLFGQFEPTPGHAESPAPPTPK